MPIRGRRFIDLTGRHFGRFLVLGRHGYEGPRITWLCQCSCGNSRIVLGASLREGRSQSCGCLQRERVTRHGHARGGGLTTRTHRIWAAMRQRCGNPRSTHYDRYGGRGITVCRHWADSFDAFLADMGECPSATHTLDRIDNDGPYSPDNCRWATRKEQSNNRENNRHYTHHGITRTLTEWAKILGLEYELVRSRIRLGWSFEDAITKPVGYCPAYDGKSHVDLTGQRFTKLTVLRYSHTANKRAYWVCQCDCGKTAVVQGKLIRAGLTRSCGCLKGRRPPHV